MQDPKNREKIAIWHHHATLPGYIFVTKAHINNRKKNLLSSNISSRCPHNMVNFGPLVAEIGLPVWGTPVNFNSFRVLAALLHGSQVVGVSQTLRRWTEGATYIQQGGHHVGHWPTFLFVMHCLAIHFLASAYIMHISILFNARLKSYVCAWYKANSLKKVHFYCC